MLQCCDTSITAIDIDKYFFSNLRTILIVSILIVLITDAYH